MNGTEILASQKLVLSVWGAMLMLTCALSLIAAVFPAALEKTRKFLPGALVAPGMIAALAMLMRGFEPIERPLVHWVFEKSSPAALRLGMAFDPVSGVVAIAFGLAVAVIGIRNRPSVGLASAMALSWAGLSLVATSKTLWMALLGMGVQGFSRVLPALSGDESAPADDPRWSSPGKRAWVALSALLCGAAGLAANGVPLDFADASAWREIGNEIGHVLSGGLLIAGLWLIASPFFSSHVLHGEAAESVEENQFVCETALSWGAVLVVYRLFGALGPTPWTFAIGAAALASLFASSLATVFQTSRASASRLWLSSVPVFALAILPFLPAYEARLYLVGTLLSFVGAWICLEHRRTTFEIVCAAIFFGGLFGLAGWSTSAGTTHFYSGIEADPIYGGSAAFVSLLFGAAGWRLVLRSDEGARAPRPAAKFVLAGLLLLLGFGPLLSGRWGGGGVPFELDWVSGAKEWAWVAALPGDLGESNWLGFGLAHGILLLAIVVGTWVGAQARLYPFAERHPSGARALRGLLGIRWLVANAPPIFLGFATFWSERVSTPLWERALPAIGARASRGLRLVGAGMERATDRLTSSVYAELFRAPAKLVQWLHGGNARLYAWFALLWILIFSIYLTR